MNEVELQNEILEDLRESPRNLVIYLEGRTDPIFFFALLGLPNPPDGLHQGVLVKGLKDERKRRGSGSKAVITRVDLASRLKLRDVCGFVDGDGRTHGVLVPLFDAPHPGPLFNWKAYCIENLVVRTGWPAIWGDEPDWQVALSGYGPYVALNRIGSQARAILEDLGLSGYSTPVEKVSLWTSAEIAAALVAGKARLLTFDVEQRYRDELADFEATLLHSLDEAHALLNGKWLLRHLAPTLTGREPSQCEYDWLAHARAAGGLAEVRDWWRRVTGDAP